MILTLYVLPILYWYVYKHEDKLKAGVEAAALVALILLAGTGMTAKAQKSYTLDSCKQITLENNFEIKNSKIETEASQRVRQAAFTKYFPNISAIGLGVQFSDHLLKIDMPGGNLPVYNGDPSTLPFATEFAYFPGTSIAMLDHLWTGAVTATQPLFTGGRIINGNQLARLGSDCQHQQDEPVVERRSVQDRGTILADHLIVRKDEDHRFI